MASKILTRRARRTHEDTLRRKYIYFVELCVPPWNLCGTLWKILARRARRKQEDTLRKKIYTLCPSVIPQWNSVKE